ncbi:citrate-Mg2+:H+ or citrate-Ca2+:H+ symporter, CitMHS family [Micromonospora pallida]|uniref:Citrate-Mg2+:H+ or citrate-Ca2+:H+ symporter, CitMHS family n=1 Tax=Micromonospora pallida TaxID=145854 RepID=A0A1C6RNR1_9ACTN|nr:citrate:proton symporter [Micromonospora pallida]SCL18692.1 citrate-Mg2+:H+ or citrate-Ca2+:H+ symporter, CitMHS family [Micromonospora pallida]
MREATAREPQLPPGRDRLPAGGLDFLALLARLLRRPRRGDRRLPVFWLVRPPSAADLMTVLRRLVGQGAHRRVPHAVVDVAALPEDADLSTVLRELHRQLCVEAFGAERIRFRHYPLADWLMHQSLNLGVEAEDNRAVLVRRLRDRRGQGTAGEPLAAGAGGDTTTIVSQVHPFVGLAFVPVAFTVIGGFLGIFRDAVAKTMEKPAGDVTLLDQLQTFGDWAKDGMVQTSATAFLLLFAILFFSVMLHVGLFDPLTRKILQIAKGDPLKVMIGTGIISAVVSLSGDGTTTTLIVCTALIPIYLKLGMRLMDLAVVLILMNTILNLLPWSGPTARVLAVMPSINPNDMLRALAPGMAVAIVFVMIVCVVIGIRERRRLGIQELSASDIDAIMRKGERTGDADGGEPDGTAVGTVQKSRVITTVNALLSVGALVLLVLGVFAPVYIFLVGTLLAFLINFPRIASLKAFIDSAAPDVLQTVIMVIGAGVFMGLFTNSGMSSAVAGSMVDVIPASLGSQWPIITALISAPGGFFISNDAFFYGVLPVLSEAGQSYGFSEFEVGYASLMGQAFHMLSPLTAFIYLLLNMTKQDLGEWQRAAAGWCLGIFVCLVGTAVLLGHVSLAG